MIEFSIKPGVLSAAGDGVPDEMIARQISIQGLPE
jgi:hypothetical protein